jgi:hypothetical protein
VTLCFGEFVAEADTPNGLVNILILMGCGEAAGAALSEHADLKQDRVHGLNRSRQSDRQGCGAQSEAGVSGARRQSLRYSSFPT